jgi:large subunit ribosomal protein L19
MSDEEKKTQDPQTDKATSAIEETKTEAAEENQTAKESTEIEAAEQPNDSAETDSETKTEEQEGETPTVEIQELPHSDINSGMIVRVHEKIKDINSKGEERERVQVFEGMVLGVRGGGVSRTITVRKDSKGFMVEKIFPLSSPKIDKIEIVKEHRVKRAKLTYLRGRFKRKMKEIKKDK